MAPLTANVMRSHKVHPRDINIAPVNAGSKIFVGAYICREAATDVVIPAADTAGLIPLGVAVESMFPSDPDKAVSAAFDNTTGADGVVDATGEGARCVRYDQSGEYLFAISGATPKVGAPALIVDDNTVSVATTNSIKAGTFTRPGPDGKWFVDISRRG